MMNFTNGGLYCRVPEPRSVLDHLHGDDYDESSKDNGCRDSHLK